MTRNRIRLSLLLAVLVALSTTTIARQSSQAPDRIAAKPAAGRTAPLWIAADVAVRGSDLDWTAFAPEERGSLERSLQAARQSFEPGEACPTRLRRSWHSSPWTAPATSLQDLFAKSASMVVGTVTGARQGFYAGFPSTMIQVEVGRQLTGSTEGFIPPQQLLLLLPQARIAVGGAMLCSVDADYPRVPSVGRRVMVFLRQPATERADDLIVPPLFSLVVELPDGKLDGPGQFADEISGLTFAALESSAPRGSNRTNGGEP